MWLKDLGFWAYRLIGLQFMYGTVSGKQFCRAGVGSECMAGLKLSRLCQGSCVSQEHQAEEQ